MSTPPVTHASWVDENHRRQPVPMTHPGGRRRCTDACCRAYRDGYRRGLADALKVERMVHDA